MPRRSHHHRRRLGEDDGSPASKAFHYAHGAKTQRHAHKNSAVFYIPEGRAYDVHDGRIKHMVNEAMGMPEHCLDMYQQFLAPNGSSARHRHLSEEILYVLEQLEEAGG